MKVKGEKVMVRFGHRCPVTLRRDMGPFLGTPEFQTHKHTEGQSKVQIELANLAKLLKMIIAMGSTILLSHRSRVEMHHKLTPDCSNRTPWLPHC